jgi:nicotinamide mononucleotide transporter
MSKLKRWGKEILLGLILVVLLVFCLMSGDIPKWLEIYGTLFGLIQAVLILLGKKENWLFYNAYTLAFMLMSISFSLYGDVVENGIYIILGVIGTLKWYKEKEDSKISWLRAKDRAVAGGMMLLLFMVVYPLLLRTDDPLPFLDAITTSMGLVATWLMSQKKVEAWIIWFADDILMAVTYFLLPAQPIYVLALNIVWAALAVGSFFSWKKLAYKQRRQLV